MTEIDIFSDTICPWCYIGKRRLERALDGFDAGLVQIRWRPYQLNPGMPPEGMDRAAYIAAKFGDVESGRAMYENIRKAGAEEGIQFAFERMTRTPNTFASHRVARFAAEKGFELGDQVIEALFRGAFIDGRDIGDRETLLDIGAECGIDPVELAEHLASDEGVAGLRAEEAHARRLGVTGVPLFIFNGRAVVTGAQDAAVLRGVLEEATLAPAE